MEDLPAKPAKCLLVHPGSSRESFFTFSELIRLAGAKYIAPPLGLMTVAALLPQHWEYRLIDENVKPLTGADLEWADIVLTGGMLPQQKRILRIVELAHNRGKPVVVGGPDPTSQPHIYQDADFLVVGEGEVTIPLFIEGLGRGVASALYQSDQFADMTKAVVPRYDLIRFADYLRVHIQFSRGCPYNCEFCDVIELYGRRPRVKTPEHILAELQTLYDLGFRGRMKIVDDNFIGNKARTIEVLQAMSDWSKHHNYPFNFSISASINLAGEEELLWLMQENDFRNVFIGFESPDEDVLIQTQKRHNTLIPVADAVRTLARHGMVIEGSFILGFDGETEHTARNMIDLIGDTGICIALVGLLFALPNTQLFRRLQREGRLFYGGQAVVEDATVDIDQMTSGLNFVTDRPRTAILQDYMDCLRQIYDPEKYYERVLRTAINLTPSYKHRPGLMQTLRLGGTFLRVSASVGLGKRTGPRFWKTLFKVLVKNPRAIGTVVTMAALHVHLSRHMEFITRLHKEKIEYIRTVGEENYNAMMIATRSSEVLVSS